MGWVSICRQQDNKANQMTGNSLLSLHLCCLSLFLVSCTALPGSVSRSPSRIPHSVQCEKIGSGVTGLNKWGDFDLCVRETVMRDSVCDQAVFELQIQTSNWTRFIFSWFLRLFRLQHRCEFCNSFCLAQAHLRGRAFLTTCVIHISRKAPVNTWNLLISGQFFLNESADTQKGVTWTDKQTTSNGWNPNPARRLLQCSSFRSCFYEKIGSAFSCKTQ